MSTSTKIRTPLEQKSSESAQVLGRLVRMVGRADNFVLGFVKCNHPLQQKELRREFLARLSGGRVLEVALDKPLVSLLDELTARWDPDNPPEVVCVYGLEKSINRLQEASPVLGRLNNDRDLLRRTIPVPLLIWLPDFALDFIARGAPDFWAWRSGVYEFATERALWHREGTSAVIPDLLRVFSLDRNEKNAEIAHLKELLRTAENLPRKGKREEALTASLMFRLALVYQSLGRWEEATTVYQNTLKAFTSLGDKRGIARTVHQLAIRAQDRGDLAEAERLYRQSLSMNEDLGDKNGIAITVHQLAMLAQDRGDLAEAERLYRQSLSMNEGLGDKNGIAITNGQLGNLHQEQGQLRAALGHYLSAWLSLCELHSPYSELALSDVSDIREQVGEEQFDAWLSEAYGSQVEKMRAKLASAGDAGTAGE